MLRKLMLLLSCVSLLALIACGEEGGEDSIVGRDPSVAIVDGDGIFSFSIEIISDDSLASLERYKEVDYAMARESFITEGFNVLFNFNHPIRNFSLIDVARSEHGSFVKTNVLHDVGDLVPDSPLVLTYYFSNGITGFYFDGPGDEGGWFTFELNSIDGEITWGRFDWNHDRELFIVDGDFVIDPEMPSLEEVEGMMPEVDPITEPEELILSITRLVHLDVDGDEEYEDPGMITVDDEGYGFLANVDFEQIVNQYDEMYDFDFIHTLDYNLVREARGEPVNIGEHIGDALLIRTNIPLREFSVISMGNYSIEDEDGFIFIPIETFGIVEYFMPGEAFIIKSYLGLGTLPWSAITFLDDEGIQRHYAIVQDQSGLFDPYRLIPFEDRTDELPDDWEPWWDKDAENVE